jgi:hypothetical protein
MLRTDPEMLGEALAIIEDLIPPSVSNQCDE